MKYLVLTALAAIAAALPAYDSSEVVKTVRDERDHQGDGNYRLDVEIENGIVLAQSGAPAGPSGTVVKAGQYSYIAPDGTPVDVKFVADENGFQPQSDVLPVAPAFPHPIPQFVLDQIAFAAEEDARRARGEKSHSREYI
ncbi:cuticle protein AMP1A-like [Portunus trituberculatus]|uniref:cuticle protein AMP1A-like n=1 Tax=Portunus trituberculatus TaxID=210409 RepID=UPI001E1D165F|nr:cuticle protein AMP1A-like [Portunus trituberculatus]